LKHRFASMHAAPPLLAAVGVLVAMPMTPGLADTTVTILRPAARENVKVPDPGPSNTGGASPTGSAAPKTLQVCPPPYHMTNKNGCQPADHR
jgi:hypothetical protein